jgi:deoxyribodipyrimidine photo-lyase
MERVTQCNTRPIHGAGKHVLYWMTSYRRRRFNFALERAVFWATELRKPLIIIEALACRYPWVSARFHAFILEGMRDNLRDFNRSAATYLPLVEQTPGEGKAKISSLVAQACLVVTDDFPAFEIPRWIDAMASRSPVLVEKVDSNGLFPMRSTNRLFRTARSFRLFLQKQMPFELPLADPLAGIELPRARGHKVLPEEIKMPPSVDRSVGSVSTIKGGPSSAHERLKAFISSDAIASGLSPYLHFGHISAHEVYQAVTESRRPNSERFLDQLLTWREIGFNMCALTRDYDQYASLPEWARQTLAKHTRDARPVVYSLEQLENAATYDDLWNSAQMQLVNEGHITNYLRMLWGKKILEWSAAPEAALAAMIHLNNKYALDGRDPNSYSGIFWILGRYDRPWGPERPIFGLVRYMSSKNTARKLRKRQ